MVMTTTKVKLIHTSHDSRSYFIKGKVVVGDGDGSQPNMKGTGRSYYHNKRPTCNCKIMDKFRYNK